MRHILVAAFLLIQASACAADPMADEVMIRDYPLGYRVAEVTPNLSGRKCSKDDILTYAKRYHFEHQAAAVRYVDRYKHCQA